MPYPEFKNNVIKTSNGLRVEFLELGQKVRIQYSSKDGDTSFDIIQTAITPLLPRGHVMPGEDVHTNPEQRPGGSEQFMHCIGTLKLNKKDYDINCRPVRDRSWRQTRTEDEVAYPPVCMIHILVSDPNWTLRTKSVARMKLTPPLIRSVGLQCASVMT